MKRIILVGMILCMILGSTGCKTNKEYENQNSFVKESETKQNNTTQKQVSLVNIQEGSEEILKEKASSETICKKIKFNKKNYIDVNQDGKLETILVNAKENDNDGYITISISVNDRSKEIIETESYGSAYLLQNEKGNIGILFEAWESNDFCKIYIYQIDKKMTVRIIDEIEGSIVKNTVTSTAFTIENYINLFGSWYGTCRYEIASNLQLKAVENFKIKNVENNFITLKKELIVKEKKGEKWYDLKCKKNKKFYPISTDNKKYMYFKTEDGKMIRIKFSREDYQVYINGTVIEDMFEQ